MIRPLRWQRTDDFVKLLPIELGLPDRCVDKVVNDELACEGLEVDCVWAGEHAEVVDFDSFL